jgi:hypothetical protein
MGGGASCPVPDKKLQDACKAGDLDAGEILEHVYLYWMGSRTSEEGAQKIFTSH